MSKYHTKREIVVRFKFNNVYEWEKIKTVISENNLNTEILSNFVLSEETAEVKI